MNELVKAPGGQRPVEIAEKLAAATGKEKKRTLPNVNTTLSRLKAMGRARSSDGLWTATGKAALATAPGEAKQVNRRARKKRAETAAA